MNPISTGMPADHNGPFSSVSFFKRFLFRNKTNVSGINQRIAKIAVIKVNCAVNRWNPHTVSIIANSRYNAFHNATRMQNSGGKLVMSDFRISKTKYIRIANRLGSHTGTKRVANHPTDTGIGSTIWFQCRWMVMGLNFKRHIKVIIEGYDSGIVFKHTYTPVIFTKLFTNLDCRSKDRFFEHVFKMTFRFVIFVGDTTCQSLMTTMFTPGLCDRFQLNIRRFAFKSLEMLLNRLHFHQS